MKPEMMLLLWAVLLAFVQMLIAVTGATLQVGLPLLAGNREGLAPCTGWAGRAARAPQYAREPGAVRGAGAHRRSRRQDQRHDASWRPAFLLGAPRLRGGLPRRHSVGTHRGVVR